MKLFSCIPILAMTAGLVWPSLGQSEVRSEVGVSESEIVVGTTTNLKGQTVGVAEEFNRGITAYLNKINATGIYGRKIKRIIYNDSYEPEKTLAETKKLIEVDKVFALIGYASTPGTNAILPLINQTRIPVIAPYSGADFLRDSKQVSIFNIKAGYQDQIEALIKMGTYSLGFKEVCIFYQNDSLGKQSLSDSQAALQKYNLKLLAQASYERNSMEIEPALKILKMAGCKSLLMASQDRQATAFIKAAQLTDFHPIYFCLNLIGTAEFLNAVKGLNEQIYVSIVTPLPSETGYPIVQEFRQRVTALNPMATITTTTLEGYLVGAVFEHILKKAGKKLTRSSFVSAFENLKNFNIGGIHFNFNKSNRQATNQVLVTKAQDGELNLLL
jgi:branched-chain amino acid transport system substrate-binding protein